MKARSLCTVLFTLPVLAACVTRPEIPRDRYGLAAQPDVYLIHHTAKKSFLIESRGDQAAGAVLGAAVAVVAMTQTYNSARLQQRLDLEDPVPHLKDRLAEDLRRDLGLTNVRLLAEASNVAMLPEDLGDEARAKAGTFKTRHPSGAVIEVVTQHWGMSDYRIKYYAAVRLIDLGESKVLLSTHCSWMQEDPIGAEKLFFEAGAGIGNNAYEQLRVYSERAEALLYANNGALLKASLRKLAERCANSVASRFLGPQRGARNASSAASQ